MAEHTHGVAWQEWGDEAFAQARAQDKPILLDIGAVWCHWCHVMDTGIAGDPDHTGTYSDPQVQQRIAADFVPIKVDNDRRPDINARYNMGGWPTTAFLTPDGDTLYGETYVPPRRMIALLDHITGLWRDQREQLKAQTDDMRRQHAPPETASPAASLDPQTVPHVLDAVWQAWDDQFGGFVTNRQYAPKFPHPGVVQFALEQYARAPQETLRALIVSTLRGMSGGGMYDRHAGGFFRYSTTRDWSVPHFEKMLEDNAKLTQVYLHASQTLDMPEFLDTARHAQDWALSDLRDPQTGAFAGSQDADAEEAYYGEPLLVRAGLPTPYIDRTVYANWNALMVSALVARYQVTDEQDILDAALSAFRFLRERMRDSADASGEAGALHHFHAQNRAQGAIGLLDDQVSFLQAALDLAGATGDARFLAEAVRAADDILGQLQDKTNGGFYDVRPDAGAIGELARPKRDMGENAEAALALLRLSLMTDKSEYRQAGEQALRGFAAGYAPMSFFAASYARAVDAYTRPGVHVVLVGTNSGADWRDLQRIAWAVPIPGKAVQSLAGEAAAIKGFPPAEEGLARAYVCVGTNCQIADTPQALMVLLTQAQAAPK